MRLSFRRSDRGAVKGSLAPVSRWGAEATGGRLAALRHPLFLAALAVLVVNDHVLKGAGILPGIVTGKLSDLAGLLVAPVLVAAVIGARSVRGRAAAFAAVAVPFAAIKLSAAAANALVAAAAVVGLRFRIWQDPTDLLAFVALYPAWRLASSAGNAQTVVRPSRAAYWAERAAFAGAAAACLATSQGPNGYFTNAYLVNYTGHEVDVRVRWVDAKLDCSTVMANGPSRMLAPKVFNLGITFRLAKGATVPLNRQDAFAASGQGDSGFGGSGGFDDPGPGGGGSGGDSGTAPVEGTGGSCEVVVIEAEGMAPTIVYWDDLASVSVPVSVSPGDQSWSNPALVNGRVLLTLGGLQTPGLVKQAELSSNITPSACAAAPQVAYQWSVPDDATKTSVFLHEVTTKDDGCTKLSIGFEPTDNADPQPDMVAYVCVPAGEFPFTSGANVVITPDISSIHFADIQSSKALTILRGQTEYDGSGVSIVTRTGACDGDRMSCGAYVAEGVLSVLAGGTKTDLLPGEEVSGKGFHVRVGRVEYVIVGRDECEAGYDVPHVSADFLVIHE